MTGVLKTQIFIYFLSLVSSAEMVNAQFVEWMNAFIMMTWFSM